MNDEPLSPRPPVSADQSATSIPSPAPTAIPSQPSPPTESLPVSAVPASHALQVTGEVVASSFVSAQSRNMFLPIAIGLSILLAGSASAMYVVHTQSHKDKNSKTSSTQVANKTSDASAGSSTTQKVTSPTQGAASPTTSGSKTPTSTPTAVSKTQPANTASPTGTKAQTQQAASSGSSSGSPSYTTADAAIDAFVAAIQNKNKSAADALETTAFKTYVQNLAGTTSYYDACWANEPFCADGYSKGFLSQGTVATQDYTAANGTKGKNRVYTITQTWSDGSDGSSTSTSKIQVAAVPVGSTWFIDYSDAGGSSSGSSGN